MWAGVPALPIWMTRGPQRRWSGAIPSVLTLRPSTKIRCPDARGGSSTVPFLSPSASFSRVASAGRLAARGALAGGGPPAGGASGAVAVSLGRESTAGVRGARPALGADFWPRQEPPARSPEAPRRAQAAWPTGWRALWSAGGRWWLAPVRSSGRPPARGACRHRKVLPHWQARVRHVAPGSAPVVRPRMRGRAAAPRRTISWRRRRHPPTSKAVR